MKHCICHSEVGVPCVCCTARHRRQATGADEPHAEFKIFTGRGDSDKQPTITALVMLDRASGDMTSTVTDKDVVVHMSQVLRASLWGARARDHEARHELSKTDVVHKRSRNLRCKPPVRWSHRESQPRSCVSGSRLETICRVLLKQHEWHSNLGPVDQLSDCFKPRSRLRRWRRRTRQWNPFEINRWSSRSPAAVSGHSRC